MFAVNIDRLGYLIHWLEMAPLDPYYDRQFELLQYYFEVLKNFPNANSLLKSYKNPYN